MSGLPRETEDTRSFSRFIPLLLFLMQKKETNIPTKLCIMVRHINYALIFAYYILFLMLASHPYYFFIANSLVYRIKHVKRSCNQ